MPGDKNPGLLGFISAETPWRALSVGNTPLELRFSPRLQRQGFLGTQHLFKLDLSQQGGVSHGRVTGQSRRVPICFVDLEGAPQAVPASWQHVPRPGSSSL